MLGRGIVAAIVLFVLATGFASAELKADGARLISARPGWDTRHRWSPNGSRIAFFADVSNIRGRLYTIGPHGEAPIQVDADLDNTAPSWSPDGQWLAYGKSEGGGLWVARGDGTERRRLANGSVYYAEWSPDGTRIAYSLRDIDPTQGSLHVIRPDGSEDRRLTPAGVFDPSWSADSRTILHSRLTGVGANSINLFVTNADGTGERQLTSMPGSEMWASWSPDNSQVVFTQDTGGRSIWIVNADGANPRAVLQGHSADWSPDGKRIVALVTGRRGLTDFNPDGTGRRQLTEGQDNLPVWSPDGRMIAFDRIPEGGGSGDLYVLDVPVYVPVAEKPAEMCVVPKLTGLYWRKVTGKLAKAKCGRPSFRWIPSTKVRRGYVIRQWPAAKTRYPKGTRYVSVWLSRGPGPKTRR